MTFYSLYIWDVLSEDTYHPDTVDCIFYEVNLKSRQYFSSRIIFPLLFSVLYTHVQIDDDLSMYH